jgi:hypothetical protein
VVNVASRKALSGCNKAIGASMMEGGIGKNEDSAKLNADV